MKRALATAMICAAALVGVSGAQAGDGGNGGKSEMAKACADLKKADKAAFKATYGKHAMRACIKGEEPAADETTPAEFKNAAKECRAEREADPAGFEETYGKNANRKNAFGKCASAKAQEDKESPTS